MALAGKGAKEPLGGTKKGTFKCTLVHKNIFQWILTHGGSWKSCPTLTQYSCTIFFSILHKHWFFLFIFS